MGLSSRVLIIFAATVIYNCQLCPVHCLQHEEDFEGNDEAASQSSTRLKNMAKLLVLDYLQRSGELPIGEHPVKRSGDANQQRETRADKDFSKLVNSFGRRNVAPSFSKWTFGKRSDNLDDYQDMDKRRFSSFSFGKRAVNDLDEKRRMSAFTFGKRGLSAFSYGKRMEGQLQNEGADLDEDKRYSAFAFGKRGSDTDMDKRYSAFAFGKRDMDKRLSAFTFGKKSDELQFTPYDTYLSEEGVLDADEGDNTLQELY